MEKQGASEQEVIEFGTDTLRRAALDGDVKTGSFMTGQIAGMIVDVVCVREVLTRIVAEAERIICSLTLLVHIEAAERASVLR